MAATIYTNITSGTTTTLITKGGRVSGSINSIMISNVDGHQADNVCLFLEDAAASASTSASNNKYYFFKDLDIPYGATLLIENNPLLSFNSTLYNLRIITQNASDGGTPNLTVIIK
tara:strand:- start:33 stop:380 length:348 start_codon:yes stop_codon:yes gene_type:complete